MSTTKTTSRPENSEVAKAGAPATPPPAERTSSAGSYSGGKSAGKQRLLLKLDANEGPRWPEEFWADLLDGGDAERWRCYPQSEDLAALLTNGLRAVDKEILLTAGADDALLRVCLSYLEPGREILLHAPTFEMIGRYARLAGASIREVGWLRGPFPLDSLIAQIHSRTAVVALVSPNNPTGQAISAADLRAVARAAPGTLLLLDLAYADYAADDLMETALSLQNALVVRTFSKAWGLAGLRVGYVVGDAELLRPLSAAGNPYAVNTMGLLAAQRALRGGVELVRAAVERVRWERARLFDLLAILGAAPLTSQANFVLAEFQDADAVWSALLERGVLTRRFAGHAQLERFLRITCPGDEADFALLAPVLTEVLS